jgi:nucleotide-binding universal stress UspA family protein
MQTISTSYVTPAKILLPMDFSDSSYSALEVAADLAQRFHAQLSLVHVVAEIPVFTGVDYFPETAVLEERRSGIEQRLAACKSSLGARGIDVAFSIETGNDVVGNIMLVIEREHIDMLVISTHGLSGWRPIVFGSIAEKVIKLAECPLLLLRSAKPAAVTDVSTHIVAPGSSASYDLAHASQSSTSSAGITANPAVEVRLDAIASNAATRSARTEQHYDQDHPIFTK